MKKYRYLGGSTQAFGLDFPEGEAVTVTNPEHLRKLANNPYFEAVEDGDTDRPEEQSAPAPRRKGSRSKR